MSISRDMLSDLEIDQGGFLIEKCVPLTDGTELLTGQYIVLLHADKVPPHLGMLDHGRYHSLTYKNVIVDQSLETLLRAIDGKGIGSLFVEVESVPDLRTFFVDDSKIELGKSTCLSPIRNAFSTKLEAAKDTRFIFELLPLLQAEGMLGISLFKNLTVEEGVFSLNKYGMEEVNARIAVLNERSKA